MHRKTVVLVNRDAQLGGVGINTGTAKQDVARNGPGVVRRAGAEVDGPGRELATGSKRGRFPSARAKRESGFQCHPCPVDPVAEH
ncbi:MAG TPA: hypothetical protein VGY56_18530 [Verrucomicrobiae bacterium]|nr:hypothetical protein [Verrucomicrobiae bacterium]